MKYYILAAGSATRWEKYQGETNKCLVKVGGERLIDRTVRLLKENGVEDINVMIEEKYAEKCEAEFTIAEAKYDSKRKAFEGIARETQAPFVILLGDCYYTEAIIKDIVSRAPTLTEWKHYYNCLPNPWTGCPWEEGYAHVVPNWEWWLAKMAEFNQKCDSGEINFYKDFQIDRYLRGYSTEEHRGATIDKNDIYWSDMTDDLDFPVDYDNLVKNLGKEREDKISVILPVYNGGQWVDRIMEQLAKQKRKYYPETELILVDDGSTDRIKDIMRCPEWKIIHKPNGGVSSARNVGLMASTGKYITFVDADDEVCANYLHLLYQNIRKTDKDYLVLNWYYGNSYTKGILHKQWNEYNLAVWGYCYKWEIIGNERFDESLNVAEDVDWLRRVLKDREREEVSTPIYRYNWGKNPNSLSHRFNRGEITKER